MTILEQIGKDYIDAYKAKDDLKVSVLRLIKSALKNEEIKKMEQLSEDDAIAVLKREISQRKESVLQYNQAGKSEAAQKEESEITIIETYLPNQLSEEETKKIVADTISELGATGQKDLGRVIGKIMSEHKSNIDGKAVSQIAKDLLQ